MLQNLENRTPIVNSDGTPTEYFIRLLQGRGGILEDNQDTIDQMQITLASLLARQIIAGVGLSGGGPLSADVTIDADEQEILDQISSTQGSILFRGAADWEALAPGTSGYVLQTNGAGSDPTWASAGGGGGGSSLIQANPLPRSNSASSTGQASKGIQFFVEFDFDIHGVRTHMTAKAGATYVVSLWTLSGGNLGTLVASTPSWVGSATAEEFHEEYFSSGPFTLSAGTTYVLLVTATSEINSYVFPMYSTTNSSYFANLPASSLIYARIATNAPVAGNAVSTGSGSYSVDIIADLGL